MKRISVFLILICIFAFSLLITGCPGPDDPVLTDPEQAEKLATDAVNAMKDGNYETALTYFSEAILLDSTNEKVVIGYCMLNIAAISVDPALVTALTTNIGFAEYPSTMNDALDPNKWMEDTSDGDSGSILFPVITGGYGDLDDDGEVTFYDGLLALFKHIAQNNTGFDFVADTIANVLGERLDLAVEAVKIYATDDMKFTITWDMYYDSIPTDDEWPYDGSSPIEIVIGKAEILGAAAFLENIKAVMELSQVYSYVINDFASYWTYFDEGGFPSLKPFPGFLALNSDADAHLSSAKTAFLASLTDSVEAIGLVTANRPGYTLSGGSSLFDNDFTFADWCDGAEFASKVMTEAKNSINGSTTAYFPIGDIDISTIVTNWPTGIVSDESIGINFGAFFSTPALALVSTTGLFELAGNGEPEYYTLSGTNFSVAGAPVDDSFTGEPDLYYMKITDATFGGTVPVDNFPYDDPAEHERYILNMEYNDSSEPYGYWNMNGVIPEDIQWGNFYAKVNGLIKTTDFDNYSATDNDPVAYYEVSIASLIPDTMLADYFTDGTTITEIRNAIDADEDFDFNITYLQFLDGNALYIGIPAYIAWNSFATEGTEGTDFYGDPISSSGSLWWALMDGSAF